MNSNGISTFMAARFGMTRALHTSVGVATPTYRACGLDGQAATELMVTEGAGFAGHGGKRRKTGQSPVWGSVSGMTSEQEVKVQT